MLKATKESIMSMVKWYVEPIDPEPFYNWDTVINELKDMKAEGETPFQLIKYDDENNIVIGTPSDSVFVIIFKNIKFNKLENQKFIFFGANNIAYENSQVYFKNCEFQDLNHLPVLGQFPVDYSPIYKTDSLDRGITPFCYGNKGKFYAIDCIFKQSLSCDDFDFFHNPIRNGHEEAVLNAPNFIIAECAWLFYRKSNGRLRFNHDKGIIFDSSVVDFNQFTPIGQRRPHYDTTYMYHYIDNKKEWKITDGVATLINPYDENDTKYKQEIQLKEAIQEIKSNIPFHDEKIIDLHYFKDVGYKVKYQNVNFFSEFDTFHFAQKEFPNDKRVDPKFLPIINEYINSNDNIPKDTKII